MGNGSVQLANAGSVSTLLYTLVTQAVARYPGTFSSLEVPHSIGQFRHVYPDWLPAFEAARLASTDRLEIARFLASAAHECLVWREGDHSQPLKSALDSSAAPLTLISQSPRTSPGWKADIVYRGVRFDASDLSSLSAELVQRGVITSSAGDALNWIERHHMSGGRVLLAGRKVVVLGAAAEMASTRLFLAAGAEVLWIDLTPPPSHLLQSNAMAGRLCWPEGSADLLTQPNEILSTICRFADGDPVDICLYAYAPGQAREIRLTGVMNAIVNAMPSELIGSVTMLVSPTTPTALSGTDLDLMQARFDSRPAWEGVLDGVGLMGRTGGYAGTPGAAATRTVVGIQGASYQAAQYLGKVIMAECWARHGVPDSASPAPLRVSANTAAITRTRSLAHPVFAAAFIGASAFGVETFTPRLSQRLNGLLTMHDWLNPEPPVPGRLRVHGGIHRVPYPLETTLRIAAAIGLARSPRLLGGLFIQVLHN
jgi:hypothetical protein